MSDPASQRILVTGGTGFIGRYVVDQLASDGFRPLVTKLRQDSPDVAPAGMDLVEIDLIDPKKTTDLVASYRPHIVLHLAGVTGQEDPTGKIYEDVNFTGTVNLLNALERIGVDRVVMLGTAAEYGGHPIPFHETMPVRPVSHYAVSKAKANQHALDMHAATKFPVTILRVFTAYGYGQPAKMFLSQLITHGLLNRPFNMSDGRQKRDFVYIDDVTAAIKASITAKDAVGRIINIGGGQGIPLRDLARQVWDVCGANADLLDIGSRERTGDDIFDTEADISLAEEVLGWRPGPGILDASGASQPLQETIRKMKANLPFVS